jgi:WD40 repeat protein
VQTWNTFSCEFPIIKLNDCCSAVCISGNWLIAGVGKTSVMWDMATMKQISDPLQGHTDSVLSVAVHDGKIVSGSLDKTIRVWDIVTMKQISVPCKVILLQCQVWQFIIGRLCLGVKIRQ